MPGDTGFRFKVRTLSDVPEHLELRLAGRLANVVTTEPNQWTEVAMPARSDRPDTRFVKMDLRALDTQARPGDDLGVQSRGNRSLTVMAGARTSPCA